jgi:hypothetical protein
VSHLTAYPQSVFIPIAKQIGESVRDMKAGSRPQYCRRRRMVQMVREGTETGYLPNSSDFIKEFEVSRRTVARDSQP